MKTVPLQFSDGFVGPPTPRTATGAGVPDSQNVCLSPDGSAIQPFPGYRRTYPYPWRYKPRAGKLSRQTASMSIIVLAQPTAGAIFTLEPSSAGGAEYYEFYTGSYTGSLIPVELGSSIADTLSNLTTEINANTVLGLTAASDGSHTLTLATSSAVESNPGISAYFPPSGFPSGNQTQAQNCGANFHASWLPGVVNASQKGSSSTFNLSSALSNVPATVGYQDSYGDTLVFTASTATWVHTCSDNSILDIGKNADTKTSEVEVAANWKTQMAEIANSFAWFDAGDNLGGYTEITNALLVVSFPPQAFLTGGGVGLGVVDQITGRALAMAFHPGGQVPDPLSVPADRTPKLLGYLNRQGPNDAVQFMHFQGLTHLVTPWDEHYVFDGSVLRKCGIRAPYGAPDVQPRTVEFAPGDEQQTIASAIKWIYGPTASAWTVNIPGTNGLISVTNSLGKTAAQDTSTTDTDKDGVLDTNEFICFQYDACRATKLQNVFTCNAPAYPMTPTGYSPVSIRVEKYPLIGKSLLNYLYWVFTYTDGTTQKVKVGTAEQHIALLWKKTLSKIDLYNTLDYDNGPDTVKFAIRISVEWYNSTPGAGNPFWSTAKRLFCFSFYDSTRMRESAPSPYSAEIDMSETAYKINVGGALREYGATWNNANPEPGIVDKVRVYTHNQTWGNDDSGYPMMRLVGAFEIPTPDADGNAWINLPGITEDELYLAIAPSYENNVPSGGVAITTDGERMLIGNQPAFSVGKCVCLGSPNRLDLFKCWMNTSAEKVWAKTDPSGKTFTCSTAATDTALPWKCSDDSTLAWCEAWDRSAGTKTAGTYTLYAAQSPTWGPWMEGREINLGAAGKFLLSKALPDHAWVYLPGSTDAMPGVDYADHNKLLSYELTGQPNRLTWTSRTVGGLDAESTPMAGYKLLDMPGDEILALGHCGEFLVAVGRSHIVFLRQDLGVIDGLATSGDPFPNPRSDMGGCVSGRTFAQLPNQSALFLGADGKLMSLSANGAQVIPLSERFKGWITSQFRVSASALKNAHAVYDPVRNWYVIFLGDSEIGPDGLDLTDKQNLWPDAPPLDKFVGWVQP
jgi:hypothetical protein